MAERQINDYKDLIVWKRAMELVTSAYRIVRKLPKEENYALSEQIRRSAVSVPSNIAEGYGRNTAKEYARFLSMARGSVYELETQLLLCIHLNYCNDSDLSEALELSNEVIKMLNVIIPKVCVAAQSGQ
ncbi:MAG: four helix bundle protein [Clostridia bacterium]|nr:four helix bundle protein [Clostridia bacterium]